MSLSPDSFAYIRSLLADLSAITLDGSKSYLVESRLLPVARQAGLASIDELVARLRETGDPPLRQQLVDAMTTNETSFFRDTIPFETLRDTILPDLIARRGSSQTLQIWSAACASGQEPFSIAMLLREHFPQLCDGPIRLLGSDLSWEMLERARQGRFSSLEIARGLPKRLRAKYFRQVGEAWQLVDELREMVQFRQLNLGKAWPALPKMDLILLRNVLVYFDLRTREDILHKAAQLLRPDGYLLLGGAESAVQIDTAFRVIRGAGFSYYQIGQASGG